MQQAVVLCGRFSYEARDNTFPSPRPRAASPILSGMKTIAIIGGGAAGLAAAISAGEAVAREGRGGDVRVVLYEADDERVGRSILATGNGRCNFSNARIDPVLYRNEAFVDAALSALVASEPASTASDSPHDCLVDAVDAGERLQPSGLEAPVHRFFSQLGLVWRQEAQGRLYPLANKASSVVDVLRAAVRAAGVEERFGRELARVDAEGPRGRIHLRFRDGSIEHADAAIVAVGGRAIAGIELPADVPSFPCRPVLGPLRADPRIARQLNNIRVKCVVELARASRVIAREQGELLFRDYGVSGVCVFNLSRFARKGDVLSIDLLPHIGESDREAWLFSRRKHLQVRLGAGSPLSAEDVLRGAVLPQVARVACKCAGVNPDAPLAKRDVPALAGILGGLKLSVEGVGDAKQCQVTRGGVDVSAIRASTMEATAHPGLFFAGEALDVDAPCGGYNLHWAWASGILAGRSAAARTLDSGLS